MGGGNRYRYYYRGFFTFLILRQKAAAISQASQLYPHFMENKYPIIQTTASPVPPPVVLLEPPMPVVHTSDPPATSYKNNENWEVERGIDGRIKNLKVIRDARSQE